MNDEMKQTQEIPPPPAETPKTSSPAKGLGFSPWIIVAALALALAGWQWMETRATLAEAQEEMARRLSAADQAVGESGALARQAQDQLAALQARLGALQNEMAASKSQQETLENLYQNLARSSRSQNLTRGNDESALTEVEQTVTLASQQLQLAGNVQGALDALYIADARLADGPQFIGLRDALIRDLDRLRALPQVDLPGMYLRLGGVIAAIDALPLAAASRIPDDGAPPSPASPPSDEPRPSIFSAEYWNDFITVEYWQGLGENAWNEMRSMMRVQRANRAEPLLLPPGQDFFLRENLKLRLLNARLALFARDQETFRNELRQCDAWIARYFNGNDKIVQNSLQTLTQLAASEIVIALPNLNESLSAIKRFRTEREQRTGG